MPWLARQLSSARGGPPGPRPPGIADSQAAGMVLTGCPAALTAPLEVIQAPGWPGTVAPVTAIVEPLAGYTFACAAAIVAIVRLDGRRCGRIHSGVTSWTAAKMARVTAMAGSARRMRRPVVTPSAKPNAAYPSGVMPCVGKTNGPNRPSVRIEALPPSPIALQIGGAH